MEKYDICVIGGGPSGYAAAMRAIDFGKKTILIERGKIGGASIYNGALTSKTTWEVSSRIASINEMLEQSDRPFFEIPWQDVRQTVSEAVFDRKQQYSAHLKLLKEETSSVRFRHARGAGKFLSKNEIQITSKKGEEVIWAENTIVATGSRPRKLPHIETDEQLIMTSDGIDYIEDYPKSLVILGAGVIGCEYATIFSNFGKTKVYLIDRADRILPFEDEDIAGMVSQNLRANGVTIHKLAKLERMEVVDGEVEYEISNPDGTSEVIRVEKALLSVGRIPNTEELGLENAGVDISDRNHILDTNTQTSIPNIYAVGDVTGHIALVNVGEIEGRYAVEKIVGEEVGDMTYDNVCTIMFLHPEVAAVGMNELQCIEQGKSIKVVKLDFSCIARAIAMRKTQGFFKIIVTDDEDMRILGMRAIGEHASSAIQAIGLLIKMDHPIEVLADLVHPHPSIIEGIQECVRMLLNKSIFKSAVFKDAMQCYRRQAGKVEHLQEL
ncbi:MAG: NAD(P)/FAD-dependent oxidoreductase [Flavobacteriales bacterium]|nr:NAD(P)/FAD-dependent oxidoreductase [Flavobacteriales bacterium]MBT3962957.1 NAD(P)/FAD-dependent oxidoreductase [Flavobacteriales bacterium]MBT4704434.1 NAD(P)/FAD-dependent oxidoreductase [Flavobacteriales bacterium]MBT4931180.1 NAD(P)/FAD-dependent oxidoreductase [Flavobacteriales bacterium]MBT5132034.1 NAD(P)/FAD-dependent oxidoreductase [Flavobacteriales bacterium]